MEIDYLEFVTWQRKYTNSIEGTNKVFYNEGVYTEDELLALYKRLKVTEVDIRGYDTFFTIELRRDHFMSLDEVVEYVSRDIIETAFVIVVRHKGYLNGRDLHFHNPFYKNMEFVSGQIAKGFNRIDQGI
jgi:hypothetical protein